MRLTIGALLCMLAMLVSNPTVAGTDTGTSGKRIALVVGMSHYQNIPVLDNPKNDARLIAETLKALGFALVGGDAQVDLDKAGFDRAVQNFGNQAAGADVALFYYAGHGLQVRGTNWLVPVNANPTKETDLDFQMVDAQLVLKQMDAAGTKLNLVILDACRNNPFGGRGLRAAGGGLAQMQAPEGTLISYATQPGNTAQDGDDGDSPYTKALAETLRTPGLEVQRVFNQVGVNVKKATGGVQQPWLASSPIDGDFYFAGKSAGGEETPAPAPKVSGPSGGDFSVDDIARQDAAARAKWETWQAAMQAGFAKASSFAGSADAQRKVWDRFLSAYAEKNPYSNDDDSLRREAVKRRAAVQDAPLAVATVIPDRAPVVDAAEDRKDPVVGLRLDQLSRAHVVNLGLDDGRRRVMIDAVRDDGPSAQAGLRPGDLILAVNGTELFDADKLREAFRMLPQGRAARFDVLRHGRRLSVNVVPGAPRTTETDAERDAAYLRSALRWAETGDAISQRVVGSFYATGRGVAQDYSRAGSWFQRAANQGDPGAQRHLGELYENGLGVPPDLNAARYWMKKAAAGGNSPAQAWLSAH